MRAAGELMAYGVSPEEALAPVERRVRRARPRRRPLFVCLECGREFFSTRAAKRAAFSDAGCPGCGGSDIDLY